MRIWPASPTEGGGKKARRGNQVCNNTTLDRFYVPLMNNVADLATALLRQVDHEKGWGGQRLLLHQVFFGHVSFFSPGGRMMYVTVMIDRNSSCIKWLQHPIVRK